MKNTKGIVLGLVIALFIVGAGCSFGEEAPAAQPQESGSTSDTEGTDMTQAVGGATEGVKSAKKEAGPEKAAEVVIDGEWTEYKNTEHGFSFSYPSSWGTAETFETGGAVRNTGWRTLVYFPEQPAVTIGVFSDDFSIGILEGTAIHFDPDIDLSLSVEDIAKGLEEDESRGYMPFATVKKIHIQDKGSLEVLGATGYVSYRNMVSVLFPDSGTEKNVMAYVFDVDTETEEIQSDAEIVEWANSDDIVQFRKELLGAMETMKDI